MDRLYYGKSNDAAASFDFSPEVLRRALANIYSKDFNPGTDIEENLFKEVVGDIYTAIDGGISSVGGEGSDKDFIRALRHSAEVFSAFKVHRAQNDMARLLLDSDGNLKPFEQWSKEVLPIASHQMGPWLRTEYDTAVARAHQAADWQQFVREKDILPNLKWMPSTSIKPGADHLAYWGIVLPVGDRFWSEHRPGDRWNCKCSLSSTDEPVTTIPSVAPPSANAPQRGLTSNPGTSLEVFSDDHPYYPDNCASCPFASGFTALLTGFFGARRKKDCHSCRGISKRLKYLTDPKYLARKDYHNLKHNPDYRDVRLDKKSGGVCATHVGHNSNTGKKEFFGGTMSGADLERICVEQLFRAGHKVILCDESKELKAGEKAAALDMQLDGRMMDIRSITGKSRWYTHALLTKNKQLKKYNARPDVTEPANTLCLYFHDAKLFNEEHLLRSINKYKHFYGNNGQQVIPIIKKLYVVIRGRKDTLEFDV